MCPVCLTTAALIAAGATSTGGLSALIAKKALSKNSNQQDAQSGDRNEITS